MAKKTAPLEHNLGMAVLLLLLAGCLLVLRPFASALLWAVVLCYSSWPIYGRILKICRQNRTLAALVMSVFMIIVVLLPFVIIGTTLTDNVRDAADAARVWTSTGPPAAPKWLVKVPFVGLKADAQWTLLAADTAKLWQETQRFIEPVSAWLLKVGLALGGGLVELALSIFIAFFLFRDGRVVANRLNTAVERIGGERGKQLLAVAGNTVRGVVYGILGTAIVQGMMAGAGFFIAGVPGAALLALLTFFLSVVPMGPPLIWVPVTLWLFFKGSTGWAIFMLIWGFGVSSIDNFVKPYLISQGSQMPFILIFFGVLGGALAFGFIGIFLGPTLLAVGFRLVDKWATMQRESYPEPDGGL